MILPIFYVLLYGGIGTIVVCIVYIIEDKHEDDSVFYILTGIWWPITLFVLAIAVIVKAATPFVKAIISTLDDYRRRYRLGRKNDV